MMSDDLRPFASQTFAALESALRDLGDAERAGLFAPTRLDTRAVFAAPRPMRLAVYRWGSLAAALAIAVTVWTRRDSRPADASSPCDGSFFGCVTGPRLAVSTKCHDFDYDADGDIDMLDMRTHQLHCEGATR